VPLQERARKLQYGALAAAEGVGVAMGEDDAHREVRSQKSEVRSQKSEVRHQTVFRLRVRRRKGRFTNYHVSPVTSDF
jgi:hypothetical protein